MSAFPTALKVLLAATLGFCAGCATYATGGGPNQEIRFDSIPTGAKVYVDGVCIGTTPTRAMLKRSLDHKVRLELAGYAPHEAELKTGLNAWIFLNIPFGAVAGTVVDTFSGALNALTPDSIDIHFKR